MLSASMDRDTIIDECAKALGASEAARKKWRQRGVPHRWRLPIIELAAARGVELCSADFERVRPPAGAAA